MGTLSSGVGLVSGMDYTSLVDQLMALEARPRDSLVRRINGLNAQKTAFLDISARVSAMLSRLSQLTTRSAFEKASATVSDPDLMTVSVGDTTPEGSYAFRVKSLASAHQIVSSGFRTRDATLPSGSITVESARARVHGGTMLEELNGFAGVERGRFKLSDSSDQSATIDITDARTLEEVIERINAAGIDVQASLRGESIVLTETSGGSLRISELDGGRTASDLGFGTANSYAAGGELVGSGLIYLTADSALDALNDGMGIDHGSAGTDFTIRLDGEDIGISLGAIIKDTTRLERLNHGNGVELGEIEIRTRDGATATVDLSGAETIGDVKTLIHDATEMEDGESRVTVVLNGSRLTITDNTEPADEDDPDRYALRIRDLSGTAAADLGIAQDVTGTRISGTNVLTMETVGDLLAAINFAADNQDAEGAPLVSAKLSADGQRLVLRAADGAQAKDLELVAGETGTALADLGLSEGVYEASEPLTGRRILSGLDTTLLSSLNGGAGFAGGSFTITTGGQTLSVDAREAETLRDVIDAIRAAADGAGVALDVGYDATGTRLEISNPATSGGAVTIADVEGTFAADIGIAGEHTVARSANLQRQYVGRQTLLADLNNGQGVGRGELRITDSMGASTTIDISFSDTTVGDVIDAINDSTAKVTARINDTGDGIVIIDEAGGTQAMKIEDASGTAGRDLNLLGEAEGGQLDGSYEYTYAFDGTMTLTKLMDEVNLHNRLAKASIFNDGSTVAPYRLNLTSQVSGAGGELIIDTSAADFGFTTLTRAQDASMVIGDGTQGGILVTSTSNTFTDVVQGMTITVNGVDDQPVNVNVSRDVASAISAIKGLVKDFNSATSRLREVSGYDAETEKAGILLGDSTIRTIESRLYDLTSSSVTGVGGGYSRAYQLGISIGEGSALEFDEEKFREAYEADPEGVLRFFTDEDNGWAVRVKEGIEAITEADGLIDRNNNAIEQQKEVFTERIERMDLLLEKKRERLLRQFMAMEESLASLQSQQQSLSSFASSMPSVSLSSVNAG